MKPFSLPSALDAAPNKSPVFHIFAEMLMHTNPDHESSRVAGVADHLSAAIDGFDLHREPPCHLAPYTMKHRRDLFLRAAMFNDGFAYHQVMTNLRMESQIAIQEQIAKQEVSQ